MNIPEAGSADSNESQLRERIAQHLGEPAYEGAPQVSDLPDKLPAYRHSDESKGLYVVAVFHGTTLVLNREPGEREIQVSEQLNELDIESKPGWYDCSEFVAQITETVGYSRREAIRDLELAELARCAQDHKLDLIQVMGIYAKKVQRGIQEAGVENEYVGERPGVEGWSFEKCANEALEEAPTTKQAVKRGGGGMIM